MSNQSKRHEFRLVLDGIELDARQQETVGKAIREMSREALASLDLSPSEGVSIHIGGLGPKSKGHQITLVLDGIELGERQQATIATAVQGGSLKALGSFDMSPPEQVFVGSIGQVPDISWIGMYITDPRFAPELKELLQILPKRP